LRFSTHRVLERGQVLRVRLERDVDLVDRLLPRADLEERERVIVPRVDVDRVQVRRGFEVAQCLVALAARCRAEREGGW
jgi:hypothetical protein